MNTRWRRLVAAAACSILTLGGGLVIAAPAPAQPATSGSFTVSGDPGDPVTGGQSYAYSTAAGDAIGINGYSNWLYLRIEGTNGDFWSLTLDPPAGQTLVAGTYPYDGLPGGDDDGAGMSLYQGEQECHQVSGVFSIQHAVYGPPNYLQEFDLTFEQHCGATTAAARGTLHIQNPPPPPVLELDFTMAPIRTIASDGTVPAHGTVSCNKTAEVNVYVAIRQTIGPIIVWGEASLTETCAPDAPLLWRLAVPTTNSGSFWPRSAAVYAVGGAVDPDYCCQPVGEVIEATVQLRREPTRL